MIDLHCHSTVSDGMLSPTEVVRLARQNGCTLLALTDHDHTGGLAEARAEANTLGLSFINGVEISVTWRGRTIHVSAWTLTNTTKPCKTFLLKSAKAV